MNDNKDLVDTVAKVTVAIIASCISIALGAIILAVAYKLVAWMIF